MTELIVEKNKIAYNAGIIRRAAGGAEVIGVVKGNGYGLGLCAFAQTLADCGVRMLAVSALEEALALRRAGIDCGILMLTPLYDREAVQTAVAERLILSVTSERCAEIAEQSAAELGMAAPVHLCVNTGLGRYGFQAEDAGTIIRAAQNMRYARVAGIFTHLSDAAGRDVRRTEIQYDRLMHVCAALKDAGIDHGMRHMAGSCAALRFPYTRLDAVRVGSAFLGRLPFRDVWGFQKVGMLRGEIVDIYDRPAACNIGYGNTYVTPGAVRTAVISAGYGQGIGLERGCGARRGTNILRGIWHMCRDRRADRQVWAEISGRPCPVLGSIGLCTVVADVSDIQCAVGDPAVFQVNPLLVDSGVPRRYVSESAEDKAAESIGAGYLTGHACAVVSGAAVCREKQVCAYD